MDAEPFTSVWKVRRQQRYLDLTHDALGMQEPNAVEDEEGYRLRSKRPPQQAAGSRTVPALNLLSYGVRQPEAKTPPFAKRVTFRDCDTAFSGVSPTASVNFVMRVDQLDALGLELLVVPRDVHCP